MTTQQQDFRDHLRASVREGLMAWRSLLDGWITQLEEREARARERRAAAEEPPAPADEAGGMANP